MTDKTIIRSLLIPLKGGQLLLPSAVVAEVTAYQPPVAMSGTCPDWLLGISHWRNQQVPLISLEKFLSLTSVAPVAPTLKHRLVVCYGLESSQLPFYALIATEVPRVVSISDHSLTNSGVETRPGLVFSVTINNKEIAWLPDLVYLETLLKKALAN